MRCQAIAFTFHISVSNSFFLVPSQSIKPPGGVQKGQSFTVPFPFTGDFRSEVTPFILNSSATASGAPFQQYQHHQGQWKDDLWDCFRYGPCHQTVWNAICCPQLLMAQVLTRLKLNWLAEEAPDHEWKRTFGRVFLIVCLYWGLTTLTAPPSSTLLQDPETGGIIRIPPDSAPFFQLVIYHAVTWSFGLYTLLILTKLRRAVRALYEIPMQYYPQAGPLEDCCLSFWCGCCVVAQMARQTADYEEQSAACCSPNGLGANRNNPVILV